MIRSARLPLIVILMICALACAATRAAAQDAAAPVPEAQGPHAFVSLYASFAALQFVDMHSTWRALDHGAAEANPLLTGVAGNKAGLVTVKAGGTAAVIAVSERLRRKNRTAAMIFMVSANCAMTWAVQHNYQTVR